jgi:hypothetical protein
MKGDREQIVQTPTYHVRGVDARKAKQWSGIGEMEELSDTKLGKNKRVKTSSRIRGGPWEYIRKTARENAWVWRAESTRLGDGLYKR